VASSSVAPAFRTAHAVAELELACGAIWCYI
jgi:hypothetical protein